MDANKIDSMTREELRAERDNLESYFKDCTASGRGVNSKERARHRRILERLMEVPVGARVRSYDFPGNHLDDGLFFVSDCYVVGTVAGITADRIDGCRRYIIEIDCRVWEGCTSSMSALRAFPPVNGTPVAMGGGVCDGVVLEDPVEIQDYINRNPNRRR